MSEESEKTNDLVSKLKIKKFSGTEKEDELHENQILQLDELKTEFEDFLTDFKQESKQFIDKINIIQKFNNINPFQTEFKIEKVYDFNEIKWYLISCIDPKVENSQPIYNWISKNETSINLDEYINEK